MSSLNQHRYTLIRLVNFVWGLFFSLIFLPIPKVRNRIIFSSSHCRNFNFNSKYLFEYMLQNEPGFELAFVINDKDKRKLLREKYGNYFISNKNLLNLFFILRAKIWVTSTTETPVMGVLQSINRNVYYLSHGPIFKNAGLLEEKVSLVKRAYYLIIKLNFTSFFTTSKSLVKYAAKMHGVVEENIKVMGESKNDFLEESRKLDFVDQKVGKKCLYVPTWRKTGEVKLFPFEDFELGSLQAKLKELNVHIFMKLHPFFEQEKAEEYITENIHLLKHEEVGDISEYLNKFDMLITDYSSLFIDYLLLNRPVLFLPYDLQEYQKSNGFIKPYDELTPGSKPNTQLDFVLAIKQGLEEGNMSSKEYREISEFFHTHSDDQSSKRIVDLIKDAAHI